VRRDSSTVCVLHFSKDIQNVKAQYNAGRIRKSTHDHNYVDVLVQELNDVGEDTTGLCAAESMQDDTDNMTTVRQRFLSECQQLIALGNSSESVQAMRGAITQLKTANASLRAVAKSHTLHKTAANTKLNKQRVKRKSMNQSRAKHSTSEEVTAVKNMLLLHGNSRAGDENACQQLDSPTFFIIDNSMLCATDQVCVEVPYGVDSEDVRTNV